MRFPFLAPLFLSCALCAAAQPAPAGVDNLTPDEVSKAIDSLKQSFARPEALSDADIARATLQGLLDRLAPAACLVTDTGGAAAASPFYSELYNGLIGYLRLGTLTGANIEKARQSLKDWSTQGLVGVVLDLRATPPSSDFAAAADLASLFCPKGAELFSLAAGKGRTLAGAAGGAGTRTFTAANDPLCKGVLVVLVDADTAEAPEAVAASLQKCARALLVGDKTAGRAYQFNDVPLGAALLRVAVAQVILSDGKEPSETGLTPDISVGMGAPKKIIMDTITAKGLAPVIDEHDRPHLNEAALVSGSNPELDELEAEQSGARPAQPLIDRQLQRALDLVTSITIYESKAAR